MKETYMAHPTVTCKVLVYGDHNEPLVTHELERNRLEIDHKYRRTVIQLPPKTPIYVYSSNVNEEKPIDYGEPIKNSLGRTVASIRRAAEETGEFDDDIIIIRYRRINYLVLIPRDTPFQVFEEIIPTVA